LRDTKQDWLLYSQTYGIDYDETFAPVAKMNTVRILISCAANFGWPLHQLDVKNAFLHGDLHEEVYMEVPPGLASFGTKGKVCRLKKSLYGLKQSPRAWFDRFRRAICDIGYAQCNCDHTVFYKHSSCKKYTLDLLRETGMIGCRAAATPIDQNDKITAQSGELVDMEKYQRLVGRLLCLCHTRPDIAYAVSIVSRYMHEPRSAHMDAVQRILRYLKGTPGKGLLFRNNGHLTIDGYSDADWASCLDDRRSTSGYLLEAT
jgi:hypothetical protein